MATSGFLRPPALLVLLLVSAASQAGAQVEDTAPPRVEALGLAPLSIDVGSDTQLVTVTLRISDDLAGFLAGGITFFSPSGQQNRGTGISSFDRISGDALDGIYQVAVPFFRFSEAGSWRIGDVSIQDNAGNLGEYRTPALESRGFPTRVEVTGGPDLTPPRILELSLSPEDVDVSDSPQSVLVTLRITVGLAGFLAGGITLFSPSGRQNQGTGISSFDRISGDALDGIYRVAVPFPRFSEAGSWRIGDISIEDNAGNLGVFRTSDLAALGLPTGLAVTSVPDDTAPPRVAALSFEPDTIDTSAGPRTVTVTLRITDDVAGTLGGGITFFSPSSQQNQGTGISSFDRISGDALDGVYRVVVPFPRFSETGAWRIGDVSIQDNTGNLGAYRTGVLADLGFPTELEISHNHAPLALCRDVVRPADGLCQAAVTPGDADAGSSDPEGGPVTLQLTPAGPFALGQNGVTLTVTDGEGAASQCMATVTVADTTPPVITCPGGQSLTLPPGESVSAVSYPPAAAGDNCGTPVATCSPPSGAVFAAGTTAVTCAAADTAGNTADCSLAVDVLTPQDAAGDVSGDVMELIEAGMLGEGQGNALLAKLASAIQQLDQGNGGAAANQLRAFIRQVDALVSAGSLTPGDAQGLLDAARALLAVLGS